MRLQWNLCQCAWGMLLFLGQGMPPAWAGVTDYILKYKDTPDIVTPAEVDDWAKRALNGEWEYLREFAAAYLHDDSCQKLQYGYRCRAMAQARDVGWQALKTIIDTYSPPLQVEDIRDKKIDKKLYDIGNFQFDYAIMLEKKFMADQSIKKQNEIDCEYAKYMILSAEKYGVGCTTEYSKRTAESYAEFFYYWGICVEKNKEKYEWFKNKLSCPVY